MYEQDPAIDREHPDFNWDEYTKTFEEKHLPLREGCVPTVFTLRPLERKQFERCIKMPSEQMASETIAYGLVGLDNFKRGEETVTLRYKKSDYGMRLDGETLDKIFAPELFADLAPRIMSLSKLDPTRG